MSSWRLALLLGALLLAGTASAVRAREAPDKKAAPSDAPPLMPPAGGKADDWKLPADAILVFVDQAAEILGGNARQIVLTPAKYKELIDEIARLKARTKPAPPAKCRLLKGRVEGGHVFFTAQFEFHADRPDAAIVLACGQAKALSAQQQDGRTPLLSSDQDGFLVQVEKPGDYQVSLDLSLPLSQRPGGRGFELDLPRAVVTTLEIDLPADARAPRLGGKDLAETALTFKNGRLEGPLGPVDKLDLGWQGAPPPGVGPLLTARGRVKVRVEDGWMTTEAELLLRSQGGPVGQWVLTVPAGAEVKAAPADQQRVQITRADEPGGVRCTVVLKEPSDDDLTLTATTRAPLTSGKRAPVGPFVVRGASRQSGVVLVSTPAQDPRLIFHPHAEVAPRDLTDDERRADPGMTAAYEYSTAPPNLPWLEVEAGSARGSIKTQAVYTLALGRTGVGGALEWQVTITLTASPLFRTGVDHVEVQLPPDCELLPFPVPDDVQSVEPDKESRLVRIKWATNPTGPFIVSLKARYTQPRVAPLEKATLPLPRALQTRDGGGQIDVTAPDEVELLPPADVELAVREPHKLSWRFPLTPEQAVVSWQPYQPEMHAASVIDVTLHGQAAQVRHELHVRFPRTAPGQFRLRTPAALGNSVQILDGGQFLDDPGAPPGTRTIKLPGNAPEQVLTLEYSFPTTEASFAVPLATVDQATTGETRVRVWSDPGQLPVRPDRENPDWSDQDLEVVKEVNRLPVLVLRSRRPDAPLSLRLDDPSGAPPATVLVDRVLYRASRLEAAWDFRASYLLRQLAEPTLDVELPAPPARLQLRVTLDGKEVDWQAVEKAEETGPVKHIARLRLGTDLIQRPAVLDVAYQLTPDQAFQGAAQATLSPPLLVGDPRQAPTRWEVTLPPASLALAPEGGAATPWTIGLRGWLLAPQVAVTAGELEDWFAGAHVSSGPEAAATPSLVCWQDAADPLTVTYVPEAAWLLACSLPLLLLGVFLFTLARKAYAGRPRAAFWFWLIVVMLVPALGAVWAFRPTVLYAIGYGCEPGAAVLLLLLAAQGVMLERYRRQIVFLPSFRRASSNSSLARANGSHRPAGEPSTVDAPRTSGSSQQQP